MSPFERAKTYKIITNSHGRKILVVNKMINAAQTEEFENEDFDAVFVNIIHRSYEETRLVMRWLSPTRVGKCFLKPRFASTSIQDSMRLATYLLDGFCETPTDEKFAEFIEEVYHNIEKFGINREIRHDLSTTSRVLTNLVKFDLSRGRLYFTDYAIKGLADGFSRRFLAMYDNQETLQLDERMKFSRKLEELGYATRTRLIDRVHVCHECGDSHQLFIECCPKCKSSDIRMEPMIHHFRCANISPATSYAREGELVCPKCKRSLRHIGVDYDRPATVFSCNCGNTFMVSAMKVLCTNCMNVSSPEELAPLDIHEYKLTPAGIKAFATDEALFQIESTDIYSGRSTYENFCESIRVFNNLPSYEEDTLLVFRYHYIYDGDQEQEQIFDVMRTIMSRNATVKLSSNGHNLYALIVAHNKNIDREHKLAKQTLDYIFNDASDESDEFDARWLKTYSFKHGDDPEEFIWQIGEKIEEETLETLHENAEVVSDSASEPDNVAVSEPKSDDNDGFASENTSSQEPTEI